MTFYEDFFERVINVTWEEEPEVYWVAGSGNPFFTNGSPASLISAIFTSEDGHTWSSFETSIYAGTAGEWGYGGFYGGGWMREGLKAGTPDDAPGSPVWVLVGSDGRTIGSWATASSSNGGSSWAFNNKNNPGPFTEPDGPDASGESFKVEQQAQPPSEDHPEGVMGIVRLSAISNFSPSSRSYKVTSSDGKTWKKGGGPASASPPIIKRTIVAFGGGFAVEAEAPPAITPMAGEEVDLPAVQKKAEKKTFVQGTSASAKGKVRKGQYAGKVLTVKLFNYTSSAAAHGDGGIEVSATDPETGEVVKLTTTYFDKETKEEKSATNCGLERTVTVAYGHYAFVVGGSQGQASFRGAPQVQSAVAYSEDGFSWQTIILGPYNPINVIAVGPKPEQRQAGQAKT